MIVYEKNKADNTFQKKLTAGTGITIDENDVISASGGGGGLNQYIMYFTSDKCRCVFTFCSKYDIGSNPDIFTGSTNGEWANFMAKYFNNFPNYNITPSRAMNGLLPIFGTAELLEEPTTEFMYSHLCFVPVQPGIASLPQIQVIVYNTSSLPNPLYNLSVYLNYEDTATLQVSTIIQKLQ